MRKLVVLIFMVAYSINFYSQKKLEDTIRTINIEEVKLKNYSKFRVYSPKFKKNKYDSFINFNSSSSVISYSTLGIKKKSKLIAIEYELNSNEMPQETENPLTFRPILVTSNENVKNNLFDALNYNYYTSDYKKKILIDVSNYNIFLNKDSIYYFGIKYISNDDLNKSIKLNMLMSKGSKTFHCITEDNCLSIGRINEDYGVSLKYKIYVDEKSN